MRGRGWLVLGFASVLMAACGAESPQSGSTTAQQVASVPPAPPCRLNVGWDPWEPYQYADAGGQIRGLDIEIAELAAKTAGCSLSYMRGEWGSLLKGLREGTVDMLLAGTVLPERQEYAWFSTPYRAESFAVFVRGEDLAALKDLDIREIAASGRKVGITDGYFYGEGINALAYEGDQSSAFLAAPFVELNYWRLLDGTTSALLDDPYVGAALIRRKGWENRIVRHPQVLSSGTVSLMFSRASVEEAVVQRFNEALARHQTDGSIPRILERYRD